MHPLTSLTLQYMHTLLNTMRAQNPYFHPHACWLYAPEVQTAPLLWGVTLSQWDMAWRNVVETEEMVDDDDDGDGEYGDDGGAVGVGVEGAWDLDSVHEDTAAVQPHGDVAAVAVENTTPSSPSPLPRVQEHPEYVHNPHLYTSRLSNHPAPEAARTTGTPRAGEVANSTRPPTSPQYHGLRNLYHWGTPLSLRSSRPHTAPSPSPSRHHTAMSNPYTCHAHSPPLSTSHSNTTMPRPSQHHNNHVIRRKPLSIPCTAPSHTHTLRIPCSNVAAAFTLANMAASCAPPSAPPSPW